MSKFAHLTKLLSLALLLAAGLCAAGCETTKGAGRDIERAGDKIEDATD